MTNLKKSRWLFLSYEVNSDLSAYGNGERVVIESIGQITGGNSSNSSRLTLPSHFGTHIDFPYHFSNQALFGSGYQAGDFIFKNISFIEIKPGNISDFLIQSNNIPVEKLDKSTELLLIKTGLCNCRASDSYWRENPGLAPELAGFFTEHMPNLRAVGFDMISLSSWQKRNIGRIAHKEFLVNHGILVIEDVDLTKISKDSKIKQIIISPLNFKNADGSPVTIFAEINTK